MTDRFYTPMDLDGSNVVLDGGEAHHLIHVLRKQVGEQVQLFDGRGNEATAEIVSLARSTAELKFLETRSATSDCGSESKRCQIVLGAAVPKGDRFRWLVEKAAELGVLKLVPLTTERSVVDPSQGKLTKLRQTVIAACKQSGCNLLMQIEETTDWNAFVSQQAAAGLLLVAHPGSEPVDGVLSAEKGRASVTLAIGPEGGLTDAEIETAVRAGARLVGLGPNKLRIETAAIALTSIVSLH